MESIAKILGDEDVIAALADDRAARIMPEAEDEIGMELGDRANAAIALISKYSEGGSHEAVLRTLRQLRNERLAHRQTAATVATKSDPTAGEIEAFYQDMSESIRLLLSLVMALAYDPKDTGEVYRHHATFFWASVRGERTEGHPNYHAPVASGPV